MWGNVKGSLVKGDSPRCGEMSKGSLVKGDSPRCGEMSRSDKGDGLPSGAGRESTSGLRDYSGSLVKGAGCEQREQTEGLKSNLLSI